MSTDIKPGQVWAWNDGDQFTIDPDIELGEDASLIPILYPSGARHYRRPYSIRAGAHLVKDATPAPLDPSAVKAEAANRLAAEVAEFLTTAMAKANPNLPVLRKMRTALTDYQPAPEPEPEYVSGRLYSIDAESYSKGVYAVYDEDVALYPWRSLSGTAYGPHSVTNIRPLVVIDPAEVDFDALAKAVGRAEQNGGPFTATRETIARAVLVALGIEVAS